MTKKVLIIPAILAYNRKELDEKYAKVSKLVKRVQIDITKKPFPGVDKESVQIRDLKDFERKGLFAEIHLMAPEPEKMLEEVAEIGHMATVHVEACKDLKEIIKKAHSLYLKIGLALNPETPSLVLENSVLDMLSPEDMVLMMGVNPGASGQKFIRTVLLKIRALRRRRPDLNIGIDGGMKSDNVGEAVRSGASLIYAGSAILEPPDAGEAIEMLRKNAN